LPRAFRPSLSATLPVELVQIANNRPGGKPKHPERRTQNSSRPPPPRRTVHQNALAGTQGSGDLSRYIANAGGFERWVVGKLGHAQIIQFARVKKPKWSRAIARLGGCKAHDVPETLSSKPGPVRVAEWEFRSGKGRGLIQDLVKSARNS
jgi:hypothetical protein